MASRSCLRGLLPLHHRATAICSAKTRKIPRPIQDRVTRGEITKRFHYTSTVSFPSLCNSHRNFGLPHREKALHRRAVAEARRR